jgi:PKD domain
MVSRRVLLPLLVVAFALLGHGQALAAPQWLPTELQDAAGQAVNADVAADFQGDAVAVWLANGEVRSSYRRRGGAWDAPRSLDTGTTLVQTQPRVVAQTDGEFVAVWLAQPPTGGGGVLRWAHRPAGAGWSAPATIDTVSCCPAIGALEAGGDGSVTVMPFDEGVASTYTKPPGSETWGGEENLPFTNQGADLAVAPDGSAVALVRASCGAATQVDCIVAAFRPPGGPWGPQETAAIEGPAFTITGYAVAANPDNTFSLVWGDVPSPDGFAPPGDVHNVDRASGTEGAWDAGARTVAVGTGDEVPWCNGFANCFDLATGSDGTQVALWQQTSGAGNQISGAVRSGSGQPWGAAQKAGDVTSSFAVPHGAVTATRIPVAAWGSSIDAGNAQASHHDGGGWHPVVLETTAGRGGPPPGAVFLGDVAADGDGNALTAFKDGNGVATAGFDGVGPSFTGFSAQSGGLTGQDLPFFAAADDAWSGPPSFSWSFGDGTGAAGASVSHAYGASGVYNAVVSAADGAGNVSQHGGGISITPAPTPPPGDRCGTKDTDKDGVKDGCDDNNGAATPQPFKTVNATVVSGDVFVKLPAGAARASARRAPKGFVRLTGAETIPVGATLDTRHGRVKVRSAKDTRKHTQTGQFFRGRFQIRQLRIKKGSKKLITDMRLTGSSFKTACGARASISAKRKRSKKRVRRLFGNAKGSFRTSGRNAAATVRGTRWSVQDRCDGTLVTVQRGRVQVRDKVRRKTVFVRTGHTYLARAR